MSSLIWKCLAVLQQFVNTEPVRQCINSGECTDSPDLANLQQNQSDKGTGEEGTGGLYSGTSL